MAAVVIDTLRYVDRLEEAGVGREKADAMARALEEQLRESMPTKTDINARFDFVDARFDRMDARLDRMDARFDRMDGRIDALEARIDALDAKFEAKFEAIDHRFEAVDHRFRAVESRLDALDDKLRLVVGVMIFGFTLLTALGLFQSYRSMWPSAVGAVQTQQPAVASPVPWSAPEAAQAAPAQ